MEITLITYLQGTAPMPGFHVPVKNLFDHRREFYAIHPAAKDIAPRKREPENASRIGAVPFHPGAARHFKEIGVIKK